MKKQHRSLPKTDKTKCKDNSNTCIKNNTPYVNIHKNSTNSSIAILFVIAIVLILVPDVAQAARLDVSKTKTVLDSFASGLGTLCGVCATIMAIYTGFKFYKGGSPLADLTSNFWAIGAFATAGVLGKFVGSLGIGQ